MVVGKGRPASLADTIFEKSPRPKTAHSSFWPGALVDMSEVQHSFEQLRRDMDRAILRHQDEIQRVAEQTHQSVARDHPGMRSAPSDGWRPGSRSFDSRGLGVAGCCSASSAAPETPKLQPPPKGLSSVRCQPWDSTADSSSEGHMHALARERSNRPSSKEVVLKLESMGSPVSADTNSTRTGLGSWEDPVESVDVSASFSQRSQSHQTAVLDFADQGSCPTESLFAARCNSWTAPVPPKVTPGTPKVMPEDARTRLPRLHLELDAFSDSTPMSDLPGTVAPNVIGRAESFSTGHSHEKKRMLHRSNGKMAFSPLSNRKRQQQSNLLLFVQSSKYELVSSVFIVLNAFFVLWQTERKALHVSSRPSPEQVQREELSFHVVAVFFCLIFLSDVLLRAVAEKGHFCRSRERAWNAFDVFVSLTASAEVTLQWCQYAYSSGISPQFSNLLRKCSVLRILRLLRVIRMTRSVRVIRFIRELRLMVFSLAGSLKSLAWVVVLMLIIILFFAVIFTDGALVYYDQLGVTEESPATKDLMKYFGTVSAATESLYMATTGGKDWGDTMAALDPLPSEYRLLFLAFITFSILALMNVVTAVFVGTAVQQAEADRDLMVQKEMEHKGEFVGLMQQVFNELDSNNSGALSLEEFEKHIEDDKIMAYLRTLEIDVSQVRTLFTLLDVDNTGEVDIDEFVGGCMRLRGGATSMDLAVLKYQVEWILKAVQTLNRNFGVEDGGGGGMPAV